ncbi:MAG: DNA polymerase [Patescibacteria group bacterium]
MSPDKTKTLVLLDVHAILHRAYHALPDFTTKNGEPTGGLYGLTAMIIKLVAELKPDYLVACYDLPEPTFRKIAYEQYKAGRKATDAALSSQIERSRQLFTALSIPFYEQKGFEADDLVGTIAELAKREPDMKIIIASGDLDTLQLVDGARVTVYTFKKGLNETVLYDEAAVRERFGFAPELLPDWKGLRGDPSDNIIGIAGIGEKTATTLIKNFGSLEEIYTRLKKRPVEFKTTGLTERVIKLLTDGEEEAFFSKTLAVIRRDAPVGFKLPERLWRDTVDLSAAETLFNQWEFRTLKERFKNLLQPPTATPPSEKIADSLLTELQIASWLINSERSRLDWPEIAELTGQVEPAAARTWLLEQLQREGLERVYREIELPLVPILAAAKGRGITLDREHLEKLSQVVHRELDLLAKKIYDTVGREFNLNSPKQLGEVLFDELHVSVKGLKKTAGGARSTRESELLKLQDAYPIITDILAHRERQKLLSTYIDALPKLTDAEGVLHATFDQLGAATGRLSSRDPNLQNIPVTGELGPLVRRAFVARADQLLVALDYSQIEMRVLAVLSGDEILLDLFRRGADIHQGVAARVFQVAEAAVTKDMRRQAKVINFGIIYGMGVNALKVNLKTTTEAARDFYERYFQTFPKIRSYFDQVKAAARKTGYTLTSFGRRRHFPNLNSSLPYVRAEAERAAMNAPVQGTAADLIKLAMVRAEDNLRAAGLRDSAHLLLTVHDELIYEVVKEKVAEVCPVLVRSMETVIDWPIPLTVKLATGPNWSDCI